MHMIDHLIAKFTSLFSHCDQECDAKAIARQNMDTFDDEQKIQYVHHVCHMFGVLSNIVKFFAIAFIFQTIIVSLFFRLK